MTQLHHSQQKAQSKQLKQKAPMAPWWSAALGALVLALLYAALPERLTFGPSWLLLALTIPLLIPLVVSHFMQKPLPYAVSRALAFVLLAIVTLALVSAVVLLVVTLPARTQAQAGRLLHEAGLLWLINILVFALWYWEIDGGGPRKRHEKGHQAADLQFPQQAQGANYDGQWAPHFTDYLFVAFTGATALSPTDTMPLTHRAKALMMVEALIALTIILLLAARAINIL